MLCVHLDISEVLTSVLYEIMEITDRQGFMSLSIKGGVHLVFSVVLKFWFGSSFQCIIQLFGCHIRK